MNSTLPANLAKPIASLTGHTDRVTALAFSPDRCFLASASQDGSGRIWDVAHRKPRDRGVLNNHGDPFRSLAFSPNGRRLAAGSAALNGFVWVYDVTEKTPHEVAILRGAKGAVNALAFSPDSKTIAGAGEDGTLRVWEPYPGTTGAPRTQLMGNRGAVHFLTFAPDGLGAASVAADSVVRLWSLSRIRSSERGAIPHTTQVRCVAYSPDGKILATGGADHVIRLWDLTAITPRLRGELKSHTGAIRDLVFPLDSKTLVSVADDTRVMNWDVIAGRAVQEWQLSATGATSFALTLDGRYLACGAAGGVIEVYRVAEKRAN
jgi:WD40 repeat protein